MPRFQKTLLCGSLLLFMLVVFSLLNGAHALSFRTVLGTLLNGGEQDFIVNQVPPTADNYRYFNRNGARCFWCTNSGYYP